MSNVRPQIVAAAAWYVDHQPQIGYEQIRPMVFGQKLPRIDDCSETFTNCYWIGGAADPNGFGYDGRGNTGSLAAHGQQIAQSQLQPADAVIYYEDGVTAHVAVIIEPGADPLTMSHGWSKEPAYIRVNEDGRPHRFFQYPVNSRFPTPKPVPKPPVPKGKPTAAQLKAHHLVGMSNARQATTAKKNGWHLWYYSEPNFYPVIGSLPARTTQYANVNWEKKAP